MTMGEKLRLARMEAGLTQRQLCGDEITRNMLSQLEHDSARPSMKTLSYLAGRLGKPVSWFLEEACTVSPNGECMERARGAYDAGHFPEVLEALASFREPDAIYDRERQQLLILARMALARQAMEQGHYPYARELLEQAGEQGKTAAYYTEDMENHRLRLLAQVPGTRVQLPGLDWELLCRCCGDGWRLGPGGEPPGCSAGQDPAPVESAAGRDLLAGAGLSGGQGLLSCSGGTVSERNGPPSGAVLPGTGGLQTGL